MLFTIGHSVLSEDQFARLLTDANIQVLVDVRSHPGSSKYPHFGRQQMMRWVPERGIEYIWEPRLGGWTEHHQDWVQPMRGYGVDVSIYGSGAFPKQRIAKRLAPDNTIDPGCPQHGFGRTIVPAISGTCTCPPNGPSWYICGFYDYSFFQMLPEYLEASSWLKSYQQDRRVAIMCAEARWFSCHRGMIADSMWYIYGIDALHLPNQRKKHSETIGNRLERYHPDIIAAWDQSRANHTDHIAH